MTRVTVADFGLTASGRMVQAVELSSDSISATVLTLGAILRDLRLPGIVGSLTLGSGRVADYEGPMCYHGALVGPVANRIGASRALIEGAEMRFDCQSGQANILHSGDAGTHLKIWRIDHIGTGGVTLRCDLPHGEGGFPGDRKIRVRFSLPGQATLRMEVDAETDRPTIFNAANHSYWNLDGTGSWAGHHLRIAADRYLPLTDQVLPTGEVAPVAGTEFDFRTGRIAGPGAPALDHNFCLSDGRVDLRPVLMLTGGSGVTMTLATTEPGVQIYDGRGALRPGHKGGEGVAIEAQGWPDAPSHPHFPSVELRPGETYRQVTEWRFSRP